WRWARGAAPPHGVTGQSRPPGRVRSKLIVSLSLLLWGTILIPWNSPLLLWGFVFSLSESLKFYHSLGYWPMVYRTIALYFFPLKLEWVIGKNNRTHQHSCRRLKTSRRCSPPGPPPGGGHSDARRARLSSGGCLQPPARLGLAQPIGCDCPTAVPVYGQSRRPHDLPKFGFRAPFF